MYQSPLFNKLSESNGALTQLWLLRCLSAVSRLPKQYVAGTIYTRCLKDKGKHNFSSQEYHTIQRQAKNRSMWPNEGELTISQPRLCGLDYSDLHSRMRIC